MGTGAAIGGVISSFLGPTVQGLFSHLQAEKAREWQKKLIIKGPSWQRRGLERAGINPLFGYGGSPSNFSGSVPMAAQISAPRLGESARAIAEARRTAKMTKAQTQRAAYEAGQAAFDMAASALNVDRMRFQTEQAMYGASLTAEEVIRERVLRHLDQARLPGAMIEAEIDRSELGAWSRRMDRVLGTGSGGRGVAGAVGQFLRGGSAKGTRSTMREIQRRIGR